jgi:hypothetical protein
VFCLKKRNWLGCRFVSKQREMGRAGRVASVRMPRYIVILAAAAIGIVFWSSWYVTSTPTMTETTPMTMTTAPMTTNFTESNDGDNDEGNLASAFNVPLEWRVSSEGGCVDGGYCDTAAASEIAMEGSTVDDGNGDGSHIIMHNRYVRERE